MTAFTDLLTDPYARRRYLLIARPHDDQDVEQALYFSDDGFVTEPGDSPSNQYFDPRIITGVRYIRSVADQGRIRGAASATPGVAVLAAGDGGIDHITRYHWLQRPVTVLLGGDGFAYDEFGTIFEGTAEGINADEEEIEISLRDFRLKLKKPIQTNTFAGTGGVEGGVSLKGINKPITIGVARNIEPVYLGQISGKETYQVHDVPIDDVPAVYSNGGALTKVASAPTAGEYSVDSAAGTFTLGGSHLDTVITCDVFEAPEVQNLCPHSEQFDQWSVSTGGVVTVTPNDALSPVGQMDADRIEASGSVTSWANVGYVVANFGAERNFSVYAEADTTGYLLMQSDHQAGAASGRIGAYFNLSTGSVETTFGFNGGINVSAAIEQIGDGKYRCSVAGEIPGATSGPVYISPTAGLSEVFFLDGQAVWLWGFQPTNGLALESYVSSSQNLIKASEAFDDGAWLKVGVSSITANAAADQNGDLTADQINFNAGASNQVYNVFPGFDGDDYAFSVAIMAVPGSASTVRLKYYNGISDNDTSAYTISETEWTRVSVTFTAAADGDLNVGIRNDAGGAVNSYLVSAAQVERANAAGSYTKKEMDGTVIRRANATAARIAERLTTDYCGLPDTDLDHASILTLDRQNPAVCGVYVKDQERFADEISREIVDSVGASDWFTRAGQYKLHRMSEPADPVAEYSETEILEIDEISRHPAADTVRVGYGRAWRVQDKEELADASEDDRQFAMNEYRYAEASGNTLNIDAQIETYNTLMDNGVDAAIEAARLQSLYGQIHRVFRVTVKTQPFAHDIGDSVTLRYPRFNLDDGEEFVIIQMDEDSGTNEIEIVVWG